MKALYRPVFGVLACALPLLTHGAWTAPPDPDPRIILQEAGQDMKDGRFDDALDKQVWIHRKSLQHASSFYGVRLSFALMQWRELGRRYPPALEALKAIRDESEATVRRVPMAFDSFHDISAINKALGEEARTAQLFEWLDANRPESAKAVYRIAETSLVSGRKFALAGKYIDAPAETDRIIGMYMMNRRMDARMGTYARDSFTHSAATLVGLLAVNGRHAEADVAMQAFLKEWPEDVPKAILESAAAGTVPAPWPPGV